MARWAPALRPHSQTLYDGRRESAAHAVARRVVIYPVLFRIGDFEVTSFGVLVAAAMVVGLWLFDREREWSGLSERAVEAGMAGVVGGLAGAKIAWAIEHAGREGPFLELLMSRGGLSWFGGFAGGLLAGILWLRWHRLPVIAVLAAATPALALAHAIGRIGCFLVGDDYGVPSHLPWAVAFPQGLPPTDVAVHPTQIYEMAALLPLAWQLHRWRRQQWPAGRVLGAYLVVAGLVRFGIEFLRWRQPIAGPFAVAHVLSAIAVVVGVGLWASSRRATAGPPPRTG